MSPILLSISRKICVDMATNVRYNSVEEGSVWNFSSCEYVAAKDPPKTELSQALYGSIIKALQPIFGDVIIAGGCLRDLRYGYKPKDVDVFVNLPDELSLELALDETIEALEGLKILGKFTEQYNIFEDKTEEEYVKEESRHDNSELGQSCVGVFELYFSEFDYPIQLIAKPLECEWNGENICATFDYNLVQQYVDSEDGEIKGVDETLKQIAQRALYLRKTGDKKTEERLHRFLGKNELRAIKQRRTTSSFQEQNSKDKLRSRNAEVRQPLFRDDPQWLDHVINGMLVRQVERLEFNMIREIWNAPIIELQP